MKPTELARGDIETDVLDFLGDEIVLDPTLPPLSATSPLFDGYLDSLSTLRLVVHLEATFSIDVAEGELVAENFYSVRRIAEYVLSKIQT